MVYTFRTVFIAKPLSLLKITSPRVASSGACSKTLRNRIIDVGSHRQLTSAGCASDQLIDITTLKALPQEGRKQLSASGVFSLLPQSYPQRMFGTEGRLRHTLNKVRVMKR